jgi:hypothetical protein
VAIWGFIAEEYVRSRDPKLLAEMDEIETAAIRCGIVSIRNRLHGRVINGRS